MAEVEAAIKQLDAQILKIQEKAEALLDKQEKLSEKVSGYQSEIKKTERQIENLQRIVIEAAELSKKDKGKPIVDVSGTLFARTSIQGPNATLICNEDYQNICL